MDAKVDKRAVVTLPGNIPSASLSFGRPTGAVWPALWLALASGCGGRLTAAAVPQLVLDAKWQPKSRRELALGASLAEERRQTADWAVRAWLLWQEARPAMRGNGNAFAANPDQPGAWRSSHCEGQADCAWLTDIEDAAIADMLTALGDEAAAP